MPTHQILASEEMVGAGHATKSDTLNRFINLITAAGDLLYGTANATAARLAKGTAFQTLGMNSGATAPTWMNSPNSLVSAAGDMIYASAANTLARLALGAANLKLFVNTGANAPEWAAGIKVGSITRNMATASGDQSYTGVGFKPSSIIFVTAIDAYGLSVGVDDATVHGCALLFGTIPTYATISNSINITDGTNACSGYVKTFDADGFTNTYAKAAAAAGTLTIYYIAFR